MTLLKRFFCVCFCCVALTTAAQYPDKYAHYRSIPQGNRNWEDALAFYAVSNLDSAFVKAAAAADEFEGNSNGEYFLFISNFKAQLLGEMRQPKEALAVLSSARTKAITWIDTLASVEYAENLCLTGRVYTLVNNYKSSEAFFKRTVVLLEKTGLYPEILSMAYYMLMQLNDKTMRSKKTQEYYLKAVSLNRKQNNNYAKALYCYIQAEGLSKAEPKLKTDFYKAAVKAFEQGGYTTDFNYFYSLLKLVVQYSAYQPNFTQALFYADKAEKVAEINGLTKAKRYSLYLAIGDMYRTFDKYDEALRYFEMAKDITLEVFGENSFEYLLVNSYIGRMYRLMKNYAESEKYYQKSISIGKRGWKGRFPNEFTIYGEISRLYSSMGKADSAIFYGHKRLCYDTKGDYPNVNTLPPIPDSKNSLRYYNSLMIKIEAYKQLYDETKDTAVLRIGLNHCNRAREILEIVNSKTVEESSGIKNSSRVKTVSSYAVYFLLKLYQITNSEAYLILAAEYSEETNANYLRFQIQERLYGQKDEVSSELKRKIAELEEKVDDMEAHDLSTVNLLDSLLELKSRRIDKVYSLADKGLPSSVLLEQPKLSIAEIRAGIPANTCVMMYQVIDFIDEEEVYVSDGVKRKMLVAFYIDGVEMDISVSNFDEADAALFKKFSSSLKTGDVSDVALLGRKLYSLLLEPFSSKIEAKRNIVVISDSQLPDIPFECLVASKTDEFLCADKVIAYHYSLGLWAARPMAGTANNELSVLAIAPSYSDEPLDEYVEVDVVRGQGLKPLPMAKEEVRQIGTLFKRHKVSKVRVAIGGVTKHQFKAQVGEYRIVHVASHGVANLSDYTKSGIYFTKEKGADNSNSYFLDLKEIYNLKTNADLVVLSACKTSVGDRYRGEGTMALPRGFVYAGVPNVIASLWNVNDNKTKVLMVKFYNQLLNGSKSYSEALQQAKLECINEGFLPMDWAGFVLIGN